MVTVIAISFLFMFLGNWFYQQHEHVKFNYSGSFWEKLDLRMNRDWFKNNSRPELKAAYPWLPMIWDGYHCFSWLMKCAYYMPFALMLSLYVDWIFILAGTVVYAFLNYTFDFISYRWTFNEKSN